VALGNRYLRRKGFSKEAAKRIAAPQAQSTLAIYESRWQGFKKWCRTKDISPFGATVPQITDFLLYLFHEKKLSVTTIKGYRTAVCSALLSAGREDLSGCTEITKLLESLVRERPNTGNIVPKWDLAFVLWALTESPFEPIRTASVKAMTWKTLFLLLLASGARRSEVHAIDWKTIEHGPKWEHVVLHPVMGFVYKTQRSRGVAKKPKVITIPALQPLCTAGLEVERTLCPVRALKVYLARTQILRDKEQRTLFVSYDQARHKHKTVHKNTLSGWVRKTIVYCYKNATERSAALVSARAHDLRGMATTLAFEGSAEMEDILQAGSWSAPNTFISHYLKSSVMTPEGKNRIGPVVAGQQIV
jgi:integrase